MPLSPRGLWHRIHPPGYAFVASRPLAVKKQVTESQALPSAVPASVVFVTPLHDDSVAIGQAARTIAAAMDHNLQQHADCGGRVGFVWVIFRRGPGVDHLLASDVVQQAILSGILKA